MSEFDRRKAEHELRLGRLERGLVQTERGVFTLIGIAVVAAMVDVGAAFGVLLAALMVKAEWEKVGRAILAEYRDYIDFLKRLDAELSEDE